MRTAVKPIMSIKTFLVAAAAVMVTLVLALLLSDRRVLVYEHKVNPGEVYVVAEHGNLGEEKNASLHCRYFTGRAVVESVFWYSPNNLLGKDSCPFIATR
jgi:hypothetical protein